ncbi:hypothetical protein M422DRAFT_246699 [Sphaerobolus stellatus SS14]|nr:hypothetical protein M422DRAFT_246699 [Sphaerobolus stellatus SS14]
MHFRSGRPPVNTWDEELHFGPASEPINLQEFYDQTLKLQEKGLWPWLDYESQGTSKVDAYKAIEGWNELEGLSNEAQLSLIQSCDVTDVATPLSVILASGKIVSFLENSHAQAVAEITGDVPIGKKKGKTKEILVDEEIEPLRKAIEQTSLKMWPLKPQAAPYIRKPKHFDYNALLEPVFTQGGSINSEPLSREILVTITTYTRYRYRPFGVGRNSQHILPSKATLNDVWKCIPCSLKGSGMMPVEVVGVESTNTPGAPPKTKVVAYNPGNSEEDKDPIAMVIEGVVYSDGSGSPDYADSLIAHMKAFEPPDQPATPPVLGPYERPKPAIPTKGPPLHEVTLRSLSLRIDEPYWLLHRGNCEHYFVVDEIRLQNPHDPVSGYPICTHRTPISRALCRICSKVPATLSILGDSRLGETPCNVCKGCWDLFGGPPAQREGEDLDSRVVEVPLVFETWT